jgi:DNA-binding NarL/FixJ family response regulator
MECGAGPHPKLFPGRNSLACSGRFFLPEATDELTGQSEATNTILNTCDAIVLMKRISVLLADDNQLVRREVRGILERETDLVVVGEARNGRQAVTMARKLRPAIILMDITMPLLNGLEATRLILKALPDTKVLMLSIHSEEAYIEEAIKAGAMGYLIKQTCCGNLCRAIREVHKGKTFFSPSIPRRLHKRNGKKLQSRRMKRTAMEV